MNTPTKAQLRASIRGVISAIPDHARAARSQQLCARLLALFNDLPLRDQPAPAVLLFRSIAGSGEIDLTSLATALRGARPGARLFAPRADWAARTMQAVHIAGLGDHEHPWHIGPHGVPSPSGDTVLDPRALDLIVCPGLAFDPCGGRLGRGGGFYDRFIAGARAHHAPRQPVVVGVCFDEQVVDGVPVEPHDCRMDAVITDLRRIIPEPSGLSGRVPAGP